MKRKNISNFILIIVGAASILLFTSFSDDQLSLDSKIIDTLPDNSFNNANYIAMDINGEPLYTIKSPLMKHFYKDDTIITKSPNILLFRDKKPPTKIISGMGSIAYKRNNIKLFDDVKMFFIDKKDDPVLKLNTEEIYIYLDHQLAVTEKKVTIKKLYSSLKGVGMKSSLELGEFVLFTETEGKYIE